MIAKETRGIPTSYLRASSDTIQHGPESREVGCGFSIILDGLWLKQLAQRPLTRATTKLRSASPVRAHLRGKPSGSSDSRGGSRMASFS